MEQGGLAVEAVNCEECCSSSQDPADLPFTPVGGEAGWCEGNWHCCDGLTCLADLPSTPAWREVGRQGGWRSESIADPASTPSPLAGEAGWRGVQCGRVCSGEVVAGHPYCDPHPGEGGGT